MQMIHMIQYSGQTKTKLMHIAHLAQLVRRSYTPYASGRSPKSQIGRATGTPFVVLISFRSPAMAGCITEIRAFGFSKEAILAV
jgi:hypothetical protein